MTLTTGTTVLVIVTARITPSVKDLTGFTSVSVDGGTPSDLNAVVVGLAGGGGTTPAPSTQASTSTVMTLTAASHMFTLQYKVSPGTSVTFSNRSITVIPLN